MNRTQDSNQDGYIRRDRLTAQEITDAVYEVEPADDAEAAVIAIQEGPYPPWIVPSDEFKLVSIGLEQAPAIFSNDPPGSRIDVVGQQRVARRELVFSHFNLVDREFKVLCRLMDKLFLCFD